MSSGTKISFKTEFVWNHQYEEESTIYTVQLQDVRATVSSDGYGRYMWSYNINHGKNFAMHGSTNTKEQAAEEAHKIMFFIFLAKVIYGERVDRWFESLK